MADNGLQTSIGGVAFDDLLSKTLRTVLQVERQELSAHIVDNLTSAEIRTIMAVGLREKNPMGTAAQRPGITMATLNTAVKRLESAGYLEREQDSQDRRRVLLQLTAKGRKVYRTYRSFHEKFVNEALANLTEEEKRLLAKALFSIKTYCESYQLGFTK